MFKGKRMYAFAWNSSQFRKPIYIKFCFTRQNGEELLVVFSFHEDYP